jgi:phytoene dehydrogenase-like protein
MAHPLDGGRAVTLMRSVEETAAQLGQDEGAYIALFGPIAKEWDKLAPEFLGPMLHFPRHPFLLARFGLLALRSARGLAEARFKTEEARALFAGIAAHAGIPLEWSASAAIGLVLGAAGHARGWPVAKGGSRAISDALISYLKSMGGELETSAPVQSMSELPPSRWVFFDLPPALVSRIAGDELPAAFRRKLERFERGTGVFKLDWALDAPIPWESPLCSKAGTIHLGGTLAELADSERAPVAGRAPSKPYVLLTQASLFDATRAPAGKHTAWAYCHVPNGSTEDLTGVIEAQIERFAPGFRKTILKRSVLNCADFEKRNPALLGGDISHGAVTLAQVVARPQLALSPYRTPNEKIILCSSSTPPGPGVHGMCGYMAARAALKRRA